MNIAVILTCSRAVIAPLFAFLFCRDINSVSTLIAATIVVGIMELTDMLDGKVARARNEVTDFGKLFDPIADTICHYVIFAAFGWMHIIPLWLFLIFIYRETLITTLRIVCLQHGKVVAARFSGKLKTFSQAMATFAVLAICLLHANQIFWIPKTIAGFHPGFFVMLIPAFFAILSGLDYIRDNRDILQLSLTPALAGSAGAKPKVGGSTKRESNSEQQI